MDCSKLSANIAAATCRTGRIDVRELMLVNWDDWQKYQREFELDGQTVPPLFKVSMGGTAGEKGSVVTSSEQTQTRSAGGYPYNYIYLSRGIESTFGKVLTAVASTPVAIVHYVGGAASICAYSDVQQDGAYTVRWADFVGEEYFIGTAEPSIASSYDLSQHRYEDKSGIASQPMEGGYAAGALPVNSSDVLRAKGPEGVYSGYSVEYTTPVQTDTAQTRGTWTLLYHVRWDNAIFRPYSDVEGTPLQWQVIYADVEVPDVTKLNISDDITYPPVVSLLTTHERGIVSFAEEVKGAYLNGYAHRIQFTAFDRSQDVKDVLNILGRGRFVALARYEQDGEDVVVVYGADCGMVAEAGSFDSSNTDGEIGQAVLATDEGCMESVPMLTLEPSGSLATVADAWEWLKEHSFG